MNDHSPYNFEVTDQIENTARELLDQAEKLTEKRVVVDGVSGTMVGDIFMPDPVDPKGNTPKQFYFDLQDDHDLYNKELPKTEPLVDGFVPEGLTVIAGNPKVGKSIFVNQLATSVSTGSEFLGRKTRKETVLYFDLESDEESTQERMLIVPDKGQIFRTYHLEYSDGSPVLLNDKTDDLLEYITMARETIKNKCGQYPNCIIIDTINMIKGAGRAGYNSYEYDSAVYHKLQRYAKDNHVSIIGISHLSKESQMMEDWIMGITGSVGLAGACDSLIGLSRKRDETKGQLRIVSRKFKEQNLELSFDTDVKVDRYGNDINVCSWSLVANNSQEYRLMNHTFIKFITYKLSISDQVSGTATELYNQYVEFCSNNALIPDIVVGKNGDPARLMGQMIRKLKASFELAEIIHSYDPTTTARLHNFYKAT